MCFVAKIAKLSCFIGTVLLGLVLCSKILLKKPSLFEGSFYISEEVIKERSQYIYYVYEKNLCFMTTLSILALAFKCTPDMIKWISQQTIDFVCYFGIGYFLQDNIEYRDLVVRSVFIFVIRLWTLYLIWTRNCDTEKENEDVKKKQDLDKLLKTFDLRHEEEGRFLV